MSDPMVDRSTELPRPVQPLEYSTPVPGRPGIITAIGVISIVVASLSLITNLGCGFQMSMFALMSRMAGMAGAAPPAVAVTAMPRPFGLPAEQLELVTSALGEVQPLDEVQARHLDALLQEHGRHIFMVPEAALTSDFVRNNVSASGTRTDGTDAPATHYIIGRGRIEISRSAATFRADTGGTAFTASWQESEPEAGLTPEQVEAVLARIQGMAGANLDPALVEAMRELLLAEDQDLIRLDWSGQPEDQINLATLQPDGTLFIQTNVGWVSMDGGGAVISSSAAFMAGPPFQFSSGAMMTAGAGILANLALAVYLLIIGIMVLRQHPWAAGCTRFTPG